MSHCNEMICQQVTLSGYAEGPKVADAVIEAQQALCIKDCERIAFKMGCAETCMNPSGNHKTENSGVCPTFYTWSFSPGCAAPDANHDSRTPYCNAHPAF